MGPDPNSVMRLGTDIRYATQIDFDKKKNTIEIENYSSEPVRLQNLELDIRK
jgi:hypothetical protein